jgi:hypothetical protein
MVSADLGIAIQNSSMIGGQADTVAGGHLMKQDDRPLATQTATPPQAPPRRPIVGVAMADDDDFMSRLHEQARQIAVLRDQCHAVLAAHDATRARLRATTDFDADA